jgi:hypothetical protein
VALTDRLCSWAWTEPSQESAQLFIDCGSSSIERQFGQAFHRSLLQSVDTFLAHRPQGQRNGWEMIALLAKRPS